MSADAANGKRDALLVAAHAFVRQLAAARDAAEPEAERELGQTYAALVPDLDWLRSEAGRAYYRRFPASIPPERLADFRRDRQTGDVERDEAGVPKLFPLAMQVRAYLHRTVLATDPHEVGRVSGWAIREERVPPAAVQARWQAQKAGLQAVTAEAKVPVDSTAEGVRPLPVAEPRRRNRSWNWGVVRPVSPTA